MKRTIIFVTILAVMLIGATVALAAGDIKTPAEIVSDLTGTPIEDVTEARADGETYGEQAADAGKLDEFKAERLEQYKLALDEAVQEGRITAERAAELYAAMEQRMDVCIGDGTGLGAGNGICGGLGAGNGRGGFGNGQGAGFGMGRGAGGNCYLAN